MLLGSFLGLCSGAEDYIIVHSPHSKDHLDEENSGMLLVTASAMRGAAMAMAMVVEGDMHSGSFRRNMSFLGETTSPK